MKTYKIKPSANICFELMLGRMGENEVRSVKFDYSSWANEFGDGALSLLLMRNGDSDPYPVVMTSSNYVSTWVISSVDTAKEGVGQAQLIYTVDNVIKKSVIFTTRVLKSLSTSTVEPPEPIKSYLDQIVELDASISESRIAIQESKEQISEYAESAESASQAIQNMGVSAITLIPQSEPTVEKTVDPQTGAVTLVFGIPQNIPVDVQIDGVSILQDDVANIPIAGKTQAGAVKVNREQGITLSYGTLQIVGSTPVDAKAGTTHMKSVTPFGQHWSVFYGLAKAAGDSTQSSSRNAVGIYTEEAKSAISDMLNAPVQVSGTNPSINAKSGIQYVCGEVSTLAITVPMSGCIDVVFTSGSTATVLTITGTVKWPDWFDPTALEANTVYKINIFNGLGVVMTWQA